MSDKKANKNSAYSGLNLLYDLFGAPEAQRIGISSLIDVLPACIKAISEYHNGQNGIDSVSFTTTLDDKNCAKDNCQKKENSCITVETAESRDGDMVEVESFAFSDDGSGILNVRCYGIDSEICKDSESFAKWAVKIYRKSFIAMYRINCNMSNDKKRLNLHDDFYVSEIRFEFWEKTGSKNKVNNLAVTPWKWDKELRSFYYLDEEGAHYVKFLVKDNDVDVIIKDNEVDTDVISASDREMFLKSLRCIDSEFDNINSKNSCKKEQLCDKITIGDDNAKLSCCTNHEFAKCDKTSSETEKECCGADFDNIDEEIFDNCAEMSKKDSTLVDRLSEFGGIVDKYAIREFGDNEYSPSLKKLYKDLIYAESCKNTEVMTGDLVCLFDYAIKNRNYEYGYLDDDKIVIAVLYDDMVKDINEVLRKEDKSDSILPEFVELSGTYDVPEWESIDKKTLVDAIRETYNFDEVVCADVPYAENDEEVCYKHCILCSFEAM